MPDMKDALFQVSNREESCKKLGSESGVLEVSLSVIYDPERLIPRFRPFFRDHGKFGCLDIGVTTCEMDKQANGGNSLNSHVHQNF